VTARPLNDEQEQRERRFKSRAMYLMGVRPAAQQDAEAAMPRRVKHKRRI
jgi:hypothetical protein